jgi:hypothetical protein
MDAVAEALGTFFQLANSLGRPCDKVDANGLRLEIASERGPLEVLAWFSSSALLLSIPYLDEVLPEKIELDGWKIVIAAALNFRPGVVRYGYDPTSGELRAHVSTLLENGHLGGNVASNLLAALDAAVSQYEKAIETQLALRVEGEAL